MKLISDLRHGVFHTFWFRLRNPRSIQDIPIAPDVFITADRNESDSDIRIQRVQMIAMKGNDRALQVADLLVWQIQQTTVSAGMLNNVTLTVWPSLDLVAPY